MGNIGSDGTQHKRDAAEGRSETKLRAAYPAARAKEGVARADELAGRREGLERDDYTREPGCVIPREVRRGQVVIYQDGRPAPPSR